MNTKEMRHARRSNVTNGENNEIDFGSEVMRFAIVGVINTAVDLAVLNSLIAVSQRGRFGLLYSIFKAISFLVAVVNSYFTNGKWTFRQTVLEAKQLSRFFLVSIAGLIINVGTATSVVSLIQPMRGLERAWPSIGAMAGAVCGLAFNFAGYKYLVFSPRSKADQPDPGRPGSIVEAQQQQAQSVRARR